MQEKSIIKSIVIGVTTIRGSLSAPAMALEPADHPAYMQLLDGRSWGNQPRTQYREQAQPRGAMGPIRSEDDTSAEGSRKDRMKSYMRQPVGNRGELGFLNWRENNSDTP